MNIFFLNLVILGCLFINSGVQASEIDYIKIINQRIMDAKATSQTEHNRDQCFLKSYHSISADLKTFASEIKIVELTKKLNNLQELNLISSEEKFIISKEFQMIKKVGAYLTPDYFMMSDETFKIKFNGKKNEYDFPINPCQLYFQLKELDLNKTTQKRFNIRKKTYKEITNKSPDLVTSNYIKSFIRNFSTSNNYFLSLEEYYQNHGEKFNKLEIFGSNKLNLLPGNFQSKTSYQFLAKYNSKEIKILASVIKNLGDRLNANACKIAYSNNNETIFEYQLTPMEQYELTKKFLSKEIFGLQQHFMLRFNKSINYQDLIMAGLYENYISAEDIQSIKDFKPLWMIKIPEWKRWTSFALSLSSMGSFALPAPFNYIAATSLIFVNKNFMAKNNINSTSGMNSSETRGDQHDSLF